MIHIRYRESDRRAVISWSEGDQYKPWIKLIRDLTLSVSSETQLEGGHSLSTPWWLFLGQRSQFNQIFRSHHLSLGSDINVDARARELIKRSQENDRAYSQIGNQAPLAYEEIQSRLSGVGFNRQLTPQQLRNVARLVNMPSGATFSVPGAGKTTEALAFFVLRASSTDRLVIVAPKNAFGAWEEQLQMCLSSYKDTFVRLRGGEQRIRRMLTDEPRLLLVTYQKFINIKDLLAEYMSAHPTYMFLDESHRIKAGVGSLTADSILAVSHLPVSKLIMSGTPMPQSVDDLVPQFNFLFPETSVDGSNVVARISPLFVRTTKPELGLEPPKISLVTIQMAPVQAELYKLMRSAVAREAARTLGSRTKQALRSLGRSVARLLQFVSNPALLSDEIAFAHRDLLRAVLAEGDSPKLKYVLERTRRLVREGHKVLIWTSFVQNVEYIAQKLADLGAVYIHGGVDAGDEEDDESREGRIKLFHDDPNVCVLVANPASAAEGISLHRVCHHAIYLDRTFNAAHFLQSEDRIHRLGLPPGQKTFIEIVECQETIDAVVHDRLTQKIERMAIVLNDPSIVPEVIPLDPVTIDDPEEYAIGLSGDDVDALLKHLRGIA